MPGCVLSTPCARSPLTPQPPARQVLGLQSVDRKEGPAAAKEQLREPNPNPFLLLHQLPRQEGWKENVEQMSVLGGECADSEKVPGQTSRSQFCAESRGVTEEAAWAGGGAGPHQLLFQDLRQSALLQALLLLLPGRGE